MISYSLHSNTSKRNMRNCKVIAKRYKYILLHNLIIFNKTKNNKKNLKKYYHLVTIVGHLKIFL